MVSQHSWTRWRKEYLHILQQRTKWQRSDYSTLMVGSVLLIQDDNAPSMHWPLGRIVELHPGKDNIIRAVSVKTKNGVYKRAATRVCVVPLDN